MLTNKDERSSEAGGLMVDDHATLDKLIDGLLAALDEGNKDLSFERLDLLWARLAVHIRAEHLWLFPAILETPQTNFTGSGGAPQYEEARSTLDLLRHDHDFFMRELANAVNTMRKDIASSAQIVTRGLLREVRCCVIGVQTRLHTHNQLEEEHVYTWVGVLLDEAEQAALTIRMRRELTNIPPRFNPQGQVDTADGQIFL
jgi:hypothetical protein